MSAFDWKMKEKMFLLLWMGSYRGSTQEESPNKIQEPTSI